MTLGLMTLDVAVRMSRCLPVRYSALVIATESGIGLTVTEVVTGAEATPTEFVAVIVSWITLGTI